MNDQEFSQEMQKFLQTGATMQAVGQIVEAYDKFAVEAMKALVTKQSMGFLVHGPRGTEIRLEREEDFAVLAEQAWLMADAMMAERKKRGLGGPPQAMTEEQINMLKRDGQ